ncbi:MAG TPA: serine hydrolase domain-containing protein [Terriglobia bacterium]|nr:serine hydrolase domain-containing protein [Terriglobia bacterium]
MKTALKSVMLTLLFALPVVLQVSAAPLPRAKPEEVGMSLERLQRIDQMLERRIAAGEMAGAVAIVARKGKVVHLAAKGVMDVESKQPVTPSTMFRIASMTKPVTSVAIMMMIEEGKIRLNDPVSRYIPEFRGQKVAVATPAPARGENPAPATGGRGDAAAPAAGGGRGGRGGGRGGPPPSFTTVAAQREVTIKDLLTHTSGLSSGTMSNSTVQSIARKQGEKLADYIPRLGTTTLEFQPGSRWAYSAQAGHDTLGRIVEIASGMPLNEFFQKRIFEPLGMKDITFWPSPAQWPRVASVYTRGANGLTKNNNPNGMSSEVYFMGSGGLISTADDYIPFGVMLANGGELNGKRILGKKTVEMFRSTHIPDTLPGRAAGEGYGLGVRVVTDHVRRGTMLSNGTFGWSGVYGTHFFVDPVEQTVGVLLVQTSNNEVNRDFEDLVAQSIID